MKKNLLLGIGALIGIALIAGCSARKLDEKLDVEYADARLKAENQVVKVDTMVDKIHWMREAHDEQDVKINKQGISAEDKSMQEKHVTWFDEYESTLAEMDTWVTQARGKLAEHDEIEKTHDKVKAAQIRSDHETMLNDLERITEESQQRFDELVEADSVIHIFFSDHAYLNKKYKVPTGDVIRPPTYK